MPDVRLRLTVEYDGTEYSGWAAQPGLRTIEGELRRALGEVFRASGSLAVAGRTDAGVHALANVASVDVEGGPPPGRVAAALNRVLPRDLSISAAVAADAGFDARRSARARSYRYRIWQRRTPSPFERHRSWWVPRALDEERLVESSALLVGERNFRAFTPTATQHTVFVRHVRSAAWRRRGDALEFEITADGFLRHMVRTLVGTLVELEPRQIGELLAGRSRSEAGATAPACGLYLTDVEY